MIGFFDDVTEESVKNAKGHHGQFDIGDNLCKIANAEMSTSQKGNLMLVLTFKKEGGEILKHYIVDNEYKNGNLKSLSDCFRIPYGDHAYEDWIGRSGVVNTKLGNPNAGGVRFPKMNLLVPRTPEGQLPKLTPAVPWESNPVPAPAAPGSFYDVDSFADDVPF